MSESFPSRPVIAIDIPESKRFSAKFVYNFFTADERINDDGEIPEALLERPVSGFNNKVLDKFSSKIPRLVRMRFSPVILRPRFLAGFNVSKTPATAKTRIAENIDKIHGEVEFSNGAFSGVGFQDTGLDGKLYLLTSGTLAKRVNSQNDAVQRKLNDVVDEFVDKFESNEISLQDAAKFLQAQTGDDISAEFIEDTMNQIEKIGAAFIDTEGT